MLERENLSHLSMEFSLTECSYMISLFRETSPHLINKELASRQFQQMQEFGRVMFKTG